MKKKIKKRTPVKTAKHVRAHRHFHASIFGVVCITLLGLTFAFLAFKPQPTASPTSSSLSQQSLGPKKGTRWIDAQADRDNLRNKPIVLRDAYSTHFKNDDGTVTALFTGFKQNYEVSPGMWEPIDYSLEKSKDPRYDYQTKNGVGIYLSRNGTAARKENDLFLEAGAPTLGLFNPNTQSFVKLKNLDKPKVTKDNENNSLVLDGDQVKLIVYASDVGVREDLILKNNSIVKNASDNDLLTLKAPLTTTGKLLLNNHELSTNNYELTSQDTLVLKENDKFVVFPFPEGHDANQNKAEIRRFLVKEGDTWYLYTSVSVTWLKKLSTSYPVTIDPDYAGNSADGRVIGESATYSTARSTSTGFINTVQNIEVGQQFTAGPNYAVLRSFYKFVTSAIPDSAQINQVNLKLTAQVTDQSDTDFNVNVVDYNWSAQDPVLAGNREAAYDGCLASSTVVLWRSTSGMSLNTQYTSSNLATSWPSKTASTYYCVQSARDDAGTTPTGWEQIELAATENITAGYRPVLTITYQPLDVTAIAATTITGTSFSANWSTQSGSGANGYTLDVATDSGFTSFVATGCGGGSCNAKAVGNVITYSVTGLTGNTTYYYRVKATDSVSGGTSTNYSNTITVTTAPAAPTANAASSITTTSFSANWSASAGATNYKLSVSTVVGCTSSYVTACGGSSCNLFVTGNVTTYAVSPLSPNTTYYYCLKATNASGDSALSNVITQLTGPAAPSTFLTIQPNGTAGLDTYLKSDFATSNSGTDTSLFVGDSTAGTLISIRSLVKFDVSPISTGNTVTSATLSLYESVAEDAAGVGSWAVQVRRILRNWVESQATWNIYSTGNNWTTAGAGSDANDRQTASSASVTLDGTASSAFVDWTSDTLISDVQGWINGTFSNYGWLIQAPTAEQQTNNAYNRFLSSDYGTVANRPKLVVEYVPSPSSITDTSFSANWSASPNATGYYLDVATDANFTSFVATGCGGGSCNNKDVGNVTTYSVTNLTASTTYYYRMRTYNSLGTSASTSKITIITGPTANNASNVYSGNLQANWTAVSGATSYELDVATTSDFSSGFVSGFSPATGITTNYKIVSGLTPNTLYYYRVRVIKSSVTSGNSGAISKRTKPAPPASVAASAVNPSYFTVSWNAPTGGASSYKLDVATDAIFTKFVPKPSYGSWQNETATSPIIVNNLFPGTAYYFRVRAVNADGLTSSNPITATPSATTGSAVGGEPCFSNDSTNTTINYSCSFINALDGIGNADLMVASGKTLTLSNNQTIAWTPGKKIDLTGGGSIVLGTGASLKQGYLTYTDADQDSYPDSLTPSFSSTAPNGTTVKSRYQMNAGFTLDCDANTTTGGGGGNDCNTKTVFVTSGSGWTGNLGGLSGADDKCNTAASNAGLTGYYRAWLSDGSTSAATRLNHFGYKYQLVDGTDVAYGWTDLTDGTLQGAIRKNEFGVVTDSTAVWTNTKSDGTAYSSVNTCTNWTNETFGPASQTGMSHQTGSTWTDSSVQLCSSSNRLYCIEQ